jgi:nucleoid-associated protein YgaU
MAPNTDGGSATDQPTETETKTEQKTYTVKAGDSLSDIAQSEMGDADRWPELYAANKDAVGDNPDMIHPGLVLTIPD